MPGETQPRDADRVRVFVRLHHAGWHSRQVADLWRAAEQLGFDGVSAYDVPSRPALECWSLLAYCLGTTSRVWGVPLVLCNPLRHPALVAKMARDLNELSGGRVVLGLGAGGDETDLQAYGMPGISMNSRLDRLDEALRIVRALFSGEPTSFAGRHYQLNDLRLGGADLAPPLLVGGHGRRLLEIAARYADVLNVGYGQSEGQWRELVQRLASLSGRAAQVLRPLTLSHNATVDNSSEEQLSGLVSLGVRWFFVVFPDVPETRLIERFATRVLPRLRNHRAT